MAAKAKAVEASSDKAASFYEPKAAVAEPALEVQEGVTADYTLAPNSAPLEGETLEQAIKRIRAVRKPFAGAMQQKLALPVRRGYYRHWFKDVAGRIDEAVASGWSHVMNPRDGKPLKRAVGTGRDNGVQYGFAMEIPDVFWQEEMDARHEVAKEKVDSIKRRPAQAKQGQAQASDAGKFYNPHEEAGVDPIQIVKG